MKKLALLSALVVLGGSLFAQGAPGMGGNGGRGMGPGMGPGPAIDWKIGTVVTTEYKKSTGTITVSTTLGGAATFKADGVEYQLWLPRNAGLPTLKTGDSLTIEGMFTTVKGDAASASVRPVKVTIAGKDYDLSQVGPGRGNDDNDPFGQGNGPNQNGGNGKNGGKH